MEPPEDEFKRTQLQNRALHKWFGQVADEFNSCGLDMKRVLKPGVDIPWTPESVKIHLWKPIQQAMLGHDSTAECSTRSYKPVYETLVRHAGSRLGVTLPAWPEDPEKRKEGA